MTGQFYDNPETRFYHLKDAVTTTAADLLDGVTGPLEKVGRVRAFEASITTVYSGTDTLVLDTVTPSITLPPTLNIPTLAADNTIVRVSQALLDGFGDCPADSPMQLATDGLSTSGVASISLSIDWY